MKSKTWILFISLLFFLLGITLTDKNNYTLINIIPLIFGVFSYILLPKKILFGPGLSLMLFVMILRYLFSPLFHSLAGFNEQYIMYSDEFITTFLLIIIEMCVLLISIRFFSIRQQKQIVHIKNQRFDFKKYSYFITLTLLIISIIWSFKDPSAINRYNFIINDSSEMTITDMDEVSTGLPRILNYAHFFLMVSLFFFFYEKFILRRKKLYVYLGVSIILLLASFYTDSSRNSMLIPLLTLLFIAIKFYPTYKKYIINSFLILIFFSMTILSMMKFFKAKEFSSNIINVEVTANLLDSYFAGFNGTMEGVKNIEYIKSKINSNTILNEILGSTIFIGNKFELDNRTSRFYNDALRSNSYIIPTIIQGYAYFGFFLSWIFTVFIVYSIFFFDTKYFKSNRIDMSFLFAFASVKLGWMHQGNIIIAMTHLNYVFILYLLIKANVFLGDLTSRIKKE